MKNLGIAFLSLAAFTLLTGARGCTIETGAYEYTTYPNAPYDGGGTVYVQPPVAGWYGDLSLQVHAPASSFATPLTESYNVTIREGGAFGAVVVSRSGMPINGVGVGRLDLVDLPYGYYDVEVLGLDYFGNVVTHAATGVTVDHSVVYLTLDLDPVSFVGDVMMEIYEPDGGAFAGPIASLDYAIWERDPASGQYILVEQLFEQSFNPWSSPVIGALEFGQYYIEVFAYDSYGYNIYDFNAEFTHDGALTVLPVTFQYTNLY